MFCPGDQENNLSSLAFKEKDELRFCGCTLRCRIASVQLHLVSWSGFPRKPCCFPPVLRSKSVVKDHPLCFHQPAGEKGANFLSIYYIYAPLGTYEDKGKDTELKAGSIWIMISFLYCCLQKADNRWCYKWTVSSFKTILAPPLLFLIFSGVIWKASFHNIYVSRHNPDVQNFFFCRLYWSVNTVPYYAVSFRPTLIWKIFKVNTDIIHASTRILLPIARHYIIHSSSTIPLPIANQHHDNHWKHG